MQVAYSNSCQAGTCNIVLHVSNSADLRPAPHARRLRGRHVGPRAYRVRFRQGHIM
jgi:hypothetical protein